MFPADTRGRYYVTLNYGKSEDGKNRKSVVTCGSKKEARQILLDHNRKQEAGTATPPAKDSLADCVKSYIDFKAASLSENTIYGFFDQ